MNEERLKYLLEKYLTGKLTTAETRELSALLHQPRNRQYLASLMEKDFMEDRFVGEENEEIKTSIQQFLHNAIPPTRPAFAHYFPVKKWMAAAALLVGLLSLTWLLGTNKTQRQERPLVITKQTVTDIAPGREGAILTLSNGKQVLLDSTQGTVAAEAGAQVINKNGKLLYTAATAASVVYNTMTTPNGRQYQLVLADGTKVWLNAASSIIYPTAFAGQERKVTITGEVYFEVAHNAAKPFLVTANGTTVQVLGTTFNVNAYDNEPAVKTTLVEGSVKVQKANNTILIKPGQQAEVLHTAATIKVNKNVEMDDVLAWKGGKFMFQDADIRTIMRQLERWYDVRAVYEGKVTTDEFVGVISRNVNISQILTMLEKTGTVSFKISGKEVVVKQ